MKKLLYLILFSLPITFLFAQDLVANPSLGLTFAKFNSSYQDFKSNHISYWPTVENQDDYNKQFDKRLKENKQSGVLRRINYSNSTQTTKETIKQLVDPISNILTTVPEIGQAPINECREIESPKETNPYQTVKLPKTFNKKCQSFIKTDGTYGTWGTYISDYIKKDESLFFSPDLLGMQSVPRTCPNWGKIDDKTKMQFWVWMMASIAQVESSCLTTAVNTGVVPNSSDRPRGLFQLPTLRKSRSWRGENCKFPTGHLNTTKAKNNILCSMDIMKEILKGKKGVYLSLIHI